MHTDPHMRSTMVVLSLVLELILPISFAANQPHSLATHLFFANPFARHKRSWETRTIVSKNTKRWKHALSWRRPYSKWKAPCPSLSGHPGRVVCLRDSEPCSGASSAKTMDCARRGARCSHELTGVIQAVGGGEWRPSRKRSVLWRSV